VKEIGAIPSPARPVCVLKSRRFPLSAGDATDGGTLNALRIVEALLDEGIDVEVFTRCEEGQSARETRGRLIVHRVGWQHSKAGHPMLRDYEEGSSFVQAVLDHPSFWPYRYRALHVHHWTSAVGLPERLPLRVRVVYTPHLLALEKGRTIGGGCPEVVLASERRILARANAIPALSRAEANSISEMGKMDLEPIIAPNGVEPSFFDLPRHQRNISEPTRLLSIARLTGQKGLDHLLDALEIVIARGLDVNLTVVGGSYRDVEYEETLRARAKGPSLRDRIRFVGSVRHVDVGQWLSNADIYVQPSRYESQCIALLEAMAAGLPVIASRLDGIREYLDEGRHGLMFAAGDTVELADQIETLIRNPDISDRLSQNARERARTFGSSEMQSEVMRQLRGGADAYSTGEEHDPLRAARLRIHAKTRAGELAQDSHVHGVLLAGSLVNGPVGSGSDVDLYLLRDDRGSTQIVPPWRFVDGETIENIHILPISRLDKGHAALGSDGDLADWFYHNAFGDHLARSETLVWNADRSRLDYIADIVAARRRPEIWRRIALRYVSSADSLVAMGRALLEKGSVEDAHQALRESAQHALIAAMIRLGWTLRGAKKRPEIASGFLPDRPVEIALDWVLDVVGLRSLSIMTATKLCGDRLRVRSLFVAELQRLAKRFNGVDSFLADTIAHEQNAIDYYEQAVRSYMVRGPVNHIRCLSGFPAIPARLLQILGTESDIPVRDFLASEILSAELRDTWAALAALERSQSRVQEWLSQAETVCAHLHEAAQEDRGC
jgi:glycosyltransferase involved in cell wall biosynthesis